MISFQPVKRLSFEVEKKAVGVSFRVKRELIDYYERRAPNPSLAFIQQAAEVMDVSVAELLGSEIVRKKRSGGPVGRMRKLFEQASQLPRGQQEKIAAVIEAFVAQHTNR